MSEVTQEQSEPNIYFDLYSGQMLVGEAAYEAHIEDGGHPADIQLLGKLLVENSELPSFTSSENNKYETWTEDDFISVGKWLLNVIRAQGSVALTDGVLSRASRLGLSPSASAITYRFDRLTNFQQRIGQEKIFWKGEFSEWDVIDMAAHIRHVGEQEGRRPTVRLLTGRIADGKKEPEYEAISRVAPIVYLCELAGFEMPRNWSARRYKEWGYMFYLANNRMPGQNDLEQLSPRSLGPNYKGVITTFDSNEDFEEAILDMMNRRDNIILEEMKSELKVMNGHAWEFADSALNPKELIRKYARYKTIGHILPQLTQRERMQLSSYDVIGDEFVKYLRRFDSRAERWLVEGAARISLSYPDIFPSGEFFERIKIDKEPSFINNLPQEKIDTVRKLMTSSEKKEIRASLSDPELLSVINLLNGAPLIVTARALHITPAIVRRRYINGAKNNFKIKSDNELPRKAIKNELVYIKPGTKPKLTKKQREILELLSFGLNRKEVADLLGISCLTVRDYAKKIMTRLESKNDVHSIMEGFVTGDISPFLRHGLIYKRIVG